MMARICQWRELERWLPDGAATWEVSCAQLPLGDLLKRRLEAVDADGFGSCTPITIHFDGSVVPRDRREAFKGAMFAAHPGDLVYSKIDVRNGAIGLVPDSMEKAVVTAEYPIHTPDAKQVEPKYLALLLRSPNFKALLKSAASGTSGRKRVNAESFEELEIPLPELTEQRALVRAYEKALARAGELDREAGKIEEGGNQEFAAALGLVPPPDLPRRPAQVARFKDIDRWSHEGILDKALLSAGGRPAERFPLVALGDVVADLSNGWSPQCLDQPASAEEWGVLKVGAVSFGEFDEKQNKALPPALEADPRLEVRPGDVLISRANVIRLVGACAIVRKTRPKLMLCDKIFRVEFGHTPQVDAEFLAEVLKTGSVRQQIEAGATGTSPTMKNISKPSLLELTFPLPNGAGGLKQQTGLVRALRGAREKAASRRQQAAKLREAAWTDFLTAIFR